MAKRDTFEEFLHDIRPMLYRQRVSYVDAGAYIGETYRQLLDAGVRPEEVLLIEPNPVSVRQLEESIKDRDGPKTLNIYNLALSSQKGSLRLRSAKDMSRIEKMNSEIEKVPQEESEGLLEVDATTLDELSKDLLVCHISILKIDVEGHELDVLKGATNLLENCEIDLIYVEAGMDKDNRQQCYYRDIEDALSVYGYRPFRFYEQMNEWMDDSPILRRLNAAFISRKFSKRSPLRVSKELFEAKKELRQREAHIGEMEVHSRDTAQELDELRKAMTEFKVTRASLDLNLERLAVQTKELDREREALRVLESEHVKVVIEREALNRRASQAEELATLLRSERDSLRLTKLEVNHERGLLGAQIEQLNGELQHVQRTLREANQEREELVASQRSISEENRHLQVQIRTLNQDMEAAVARESAASQELSMLARELEGIQCQVNEKVAHNNVLALRLEKANAAYRAFAAKLNSEFSGALDSVFDEHRALMKESVRICMARESEAICEVWQEHNRIIKEIEKKCKVLTQHYERLSKAASWYRECYFKVLASRSWRIGILFRTPRIVCQRVRAYVLRRPVTRRADPPAIESFDQVVRKAMKELSKSSGAAKTQPSPWGGSRKLPTPSLERPRLTVKVEDYMPADAGEIGNPVDAHIDKQLAVVRERYESETAGLRFQLMRAREELAFYKRQLQNAGIFPVAADPEGVFVSSIDVKTAPMDS